MIFINYLSVIYFFLKDILFRLGFFLVFYFIIFFKEYDFIKLNMNCDEIFINFYYCIVMVEILICGMEIVRVGL